MTKVAALLLGVVVAACAWWAVAAGPLRNPHDALEDFYGGQERAEDQLMDPLILNGRRVVPFVISEVADKRMRHRRYAIEFLGNGGYSEALPVLERVLADESELYYFRADALEAIFRISPERAGELASLHLRAEDLLGSVAQEIDAGRNPLHRSRSYWQALWHVHE